MRIRYHLQAAACLASVTVCATAWAGPAPDTVLVLDLRPIGVADAAAAAVTTQLADAIAARPGYTVSTGQDLKDVLALEKTRQLMGCDDDVACLAELSSRADAKFLVAGSVGQVGRSFVINLTLLQADDAATQSRASDTVEGLDEMPAVLPRLAAELFGWESTQARRSFTLPSAAGLSFAVFDLRASGVAQETADSLTQVLSAEIKRVEGATVISRDDLMAMLQWDKQKSLFGCEDDTSCIAEIGGALGVDKLVVGSVGKLAQSYVVTARLIDSRRVLVDNRVTETFRGEEDQLIRAVREAGRQLLGLSSDQTGSLAVTASQEGAEVFIDNTSRGVLPIPPVSELPPGRHLVRLAKDGFLDWQNDFYVDPGEATVVWAKLTEAPEKWYQKWWVWAIAGGVVAAGGATAVILLRPEPSTGNGTVDLP